MEHEVDEEASGFYAMGTETKRMVRRQVVEIGENDRMLLADHLYISLDFC
jgi:hypothetical protein